MVAGSSPDPVSAAASSSSVKNALPSARANTPSTTPAGGAPPRIAAICAADSARPNRASSTRPAPARPSSARNGPSHGLPGSSLRWVTSRTTRWRRRLRAR